MNWWNDDLTIQHFKNVSRKKKKRPHLVLVVLKGRTLALTAFTVLLSFFENLFGVFCDFEAVLLFPECSAGSGSAPLPFTLWLLWWKGGFPDDYAFETYLNTTCTTVRSCRGVINAALLVQQSLVSSWFLWKRRLACLWKLSCVHFVLNWVF